ncbi:protein kinase domain containing, partial [Mytilus galloprovincialis]
MTYEEMKTLGRSVGLEIKDRHEMNLFLRYQHDVGNLIYFEDIPDLVILQPQWLVDVLKCIVSARKFQIQRNIVYNSDWKELEATGRLTEDLITQAFTGEGEGKDFVKYRPHFLRIMEKFDIIVKPVLAKEESVSSLDGYGAIDKSKMPTVHYYVPCLIKSKAISNIVDSFKVDGKDFNRTSWMCMHHVREQEELNSEMLNYVRLAKTVTDLMPEVMVEQLKSDGFELTANTSKTFRYLFTSFQLQNKHKPTSGKWASPMCPNEDTEISVGDDVKRWRFVLNELKSHSKISRESIVGLEKVLANVFIRSEKLFESCSFVSKYQKIMTDMFEANDYDIYLQRVKHGDVFQL